MRFYTGVPRQSQNADWHGFWNNKLRCRLGLAHQQPFLQLLLEFSSAFDWSKCNLPTLGSSLPCGRSTGDPVGSRSLATVPSVLN